ncbi:MAG: hypothetical protein COV70_03635 [Parcubacteria group bacterium CG11_big_fil_rev_8_21_14_0_20_39_22]|nr:MAG: hypothetical protein COV70_03635 [Parcubacteria group bacterium CG11_big_fil_rev_8_21_14_0_20_39_22]
MERLQVVMSFLDSEKFLAVCFLVVALISFLLSISFIYHFKKYGAHVASISLVTFGYIVITLCLLVVSAILLSFSLL